MPVLYYCDHYEFPLPPGHKFPGGKYMLLRQALQLDARFQFQPSPPAPPHIIELIHTKEYVEQFLTGTLDLRVMRRIGFPWSEQLVLRTLGSVGGTLEAARDALCRGWGGNLAGGTHHAFREEGAGFCVFNDIAIAIASLREDESIRRAAVVDLDVHQGDGTAKIFEKDSNVLTVSLHGGNNFPFRKQTSKIDVPLPDGTGDEAYLERLRSVLPRVFAFQPDIVFYQSGVDALETDRLGRLRMTHKGLEQRDEMVFEACRGARTPCVVTLGGGYSEPIEHTVNAHANTFRTALRVYSK